MAAAPSAAQLDPGEGLRVLGVERSGAEPGGGSCEHSLQGVFTQQTFPGLSSVLVLASGPLGFSSRTQGAPAARSACPAVCPSAAELAGLILVVALGWRLLGAGGQGGGTSKGPEAGGNIREPGAV